MNISLAEICFFTELGKWTDISSAEMLFFFIEFGKLTVIQQSLVLYSTLIIHFVS